MLIPRRGVKIIFQGIHMTPNELMKKKFYLDYTYNCHHRHPLESDLFY